MQNGSVMLTTDGFGCAAVVRHQGGLRSRGPGWRHSAPRRDRPSQEQLLLLNSASAAGPCPFSRVCCPGMPGRLIEQPPGDARMRISCGPSIISGPAERACVDGSCPWTTCTIGNGGLCVFGVHCTGIYADIQRLGRYKERKQQTDGW